MSWFANSIADITTTIQSSVKDISDLSQQQQRQQEQQQTESTTTTTTPSPPNDNNNPSNEQNTGNLFSKLTLTSPELRAEWDQIEAEERHKERVKDYLSELLPWETRDEERTILVEECREKILGLSMDVETFVGPYEIPGGMNAMFGGKVVVDDDDDDVVGAEGDEVKKKEEEDGKDNVSESDDKKDGDGGKDEGRKDNTAEESEEKKKIPSNEEKLQRLEPLPPLLDDFDLDSHVGLIQRLFKVDPNLVAMHAELSGAGPKELAFWRNYFFHCAYARYEAGLSIDEIWATKAHPGPPTPMKGTGGAAQEVMGNVTNLVGGFLGNIVGSNTNTDGSQTTNPPQVDGEKNDIISTDDSEEVVHFDKMSSSSLPPVASSGSNVPSPSVNAETSVVETAKNNNASAPPSSAGGGGGGASATAASNASRDVPSSPSSQQLVSDYEVVGSENALDDNDVDLGDLDGMGNGGGDDDDLDSLEAEIARELED